MKPLHQVIDDAVTIRGIIDYLEKSVEPVSLHELAMTQHISNVYNAEDLARGAA